MTNAFNYVDGRISLFFVGNSRAKHSLMLTDDSNVELISQLMDELIHDRSHNMFVFPGLFSWKKCTNETDGRVEHIYNLHGFATEEGECEKVSNFGRENATGKTVNYLSGISHQMLGNMQLRPGSLPSQLPCRFSLAEGLDSISCWCICIAHLLPLTSEVVNFQGGNIWEFDMMAWRIDDW